jgi:putative intracellular protease/amidase
MAPTIAVILIDRFADWEHGFLTAPIRDFFNGTVRFYTPNGGAVTSEGGMRAEADAGFDALNPDIYDALAVIGSGLWMKDGAPDISALAQASDRAGRLTGFICGGTAAAARAGLLDTRAHTSNSLETLTAIPAYSGKAHYQDVPRAVRNGNLVTAAGFAPRSFAFEMLQALLPGETKNLGYYKDELTAERFV